MKAYIAIILLVLIASTSVFAQTKLSESKQHSSDLYIYEISNENLRKIQLKDDEPDENMLQTFVSSYPRGTKIPELPRGNYIIAGTEKNQLVFGDHTVDDFNFKIISGEKTMLCLYDSLGNIIHDAIVKCGSSTLPFNKNTQTYNTKKFKDEQIIEVNNRGVLHYLEIETATKNYFSKSGFFKKSWWKIQGTWINTKYNVIGLFNPDEQPIRNKYTGFIVFNKPKYKPGETVKLKAYMAEHNGKPYNKPVSVSLRGYYQDKTDTILIKNLAPYRPGMYQYQFELSDSLNLKLDSRFHINLKTDNINDNFLSNNFRYEEYELKSTHFSMSASKEKYAVGDPIKITLKATDENQIAMYGGRVEVLVSPGTFSKYDMNGFSSV